MKFRSIASLVGALGLLALGAAPTQAQERQTQCFWPNEWTGWKAAPDSKSIYLRVDVTRIYRLDLANACPVLQDPDAHLILHQRGAETYCTALDFDLEVAEPQGVRMPCIVSNMTQLTPAEAAALPKDLRP